MSSPTRSKVKYAIFATLPTVVAGTVFLLWYRYHFDPVRRGQDLNRTAWEASYTERGQPIPKSGPREGFWFARMSPRLPHPDPAIGWRDRPTYFRDLMDIDEDGYQKYISPADKKADLVILGASVAFGMNASSIANTYFAVLGAELDEMGTPADIVVVATGVWKSSQELAALKLYLGEEHRPDVIVFLDGLNDLTAGATANTLYFEKTETRDGSAWHPEYHAHDYEDRVKVYLNNMRQAAEVAGQIKSKLLIVLQPSLVEKKDRSRIEEQLLRGSLLKHSSAQALEQSYEQMRQGLSELARSGKVHFLDCSRTFDEEKATTFADLWHFSDFGQKLLGKAMAREIAPLLAKAKKASSSVGHP
jgi:hypothetical protein